MIFHGDLLVYRRVLHIKQILRRHLLGSHRPLKWIIQWLFLVPVKGGIGSKKKNRFGKDYKWYISGIYYQLGDGLCHLPPFTGTKNNHILIGFCPGSGGGDSPIIFPKVPQSSQTESLGFSRYPLVVTGILGGG